MLKINPESTLAGWYTSRLGLQQQVKEEQQLGSPERAQSHTQMPVPAVHFGQLQAVALSPRLRGNHTGWSTAGPDQGLGYCYRCRLTDNRNIFCWLFKKKKKSWSSCDLYVPSASLALLLQCQACFFSLFLSSFQFWRTSIQILIRFHTIRNKPSHYDSKSNTNSITQKMIRYIKPTTIPMCQEKSWITWQCTLVFMH